MSSVIPKVFRQSRKPKNFSDLDSSVKFVSRIVKASLQKDCWVDGSYLDGSNALDSDLDIAVKLISKNDLKIAQELSDILGVKLDIIQREKVNDKFRV